MNSKRKLLWFYILFCFSVQVLGQETSPIINFSPSAYNAGNQNWDIAENDLGNIFIANNEGLLVYNGANWNLYPIPNQAIVRSVVAVGPNVYVGSFMEFGYFSMDSHGDFLYQSLSERVEMLEDEIIWHTRYLDGNVIFQSLDRLYIYDIKTDIIQVLTEEKSFVRTFVVDNQLLVQKKNSGIYKLEKGVQQKIIDLPRDLAGDLIVNIFKFDDKILLFSRHLGIFQWEKGVLTKYLSDFEKYFSNKKIFSAAKNQNNELFIGTISEGLIKLDSKGKLQSVVTQGNGLSNNTILNIFGDSNKNIWLALDNGVDCMNDQSFVTEYINSKGVLGTVYATLAFDDGLYLGSNQGLFFKPSTKSEPLYLIPGTEGQVWSLVEHDGQVFCGHALGVFQVNGKNARLSAGVPGVWDFKVIDDHPNRLMFGSYSGLYIIEKKNGKWDSSFKLEGFDYSSRFFEINSAGDIWVNHENKGLFLLEFDLANRQVKIKKEITDLPRSQGSSLVKFDGSIFYSSKNGVFNLENSGDWTKIESLSTLIDEENYSTAKLISDPINERLWSFKKDGLAYARKSAVNNTYEIDFIPLPDHLRRSVVSFENIRGILGEEYLLGKTNGYLRLDFSKRAFQDPDIYINKVMVSGDTSYLVKLKEKALVPFKNRSISFWYNMPYFEKYQDKKYSVRLIGYQDEWSSWDESNSIKYEKLPFGKYIFEVKGEVAGKSTSKIESFEFEVLRPFYLSYAMLSFYSFLIFGIGVLVHKSYKKHFQRKAEQARLKNLQELETIKIKNEQKITDLKNKQLEVEIESKNRELAILTMNNIKRNDFLRKVKKELKTQTNLPESSTVYKLIDSNLNNVKDWEFFEEAFNNADKEFLERAKNYCPDLNRNDLKFCTYIRLNLSAKEIASLLNISVKSVEIKRYRLRKKLGLEAEVNLNDFISSL